MGLRELRLTMGYSSRKLSNLTGVAKNSILAMETGQKDINYASIKSLCALAIALDCTLYDLLTDDKLKENLSLAMRKKTQIDIWRHIQL